MDYSEMKELEMDDERKCTYCNQCQPCPLKLDIGLINKYYDLAKAGDAQAREDYMKLDVKASSCFGCGHCNMMCPNGVYQSEKMGEIRKFFGE